MESFRYVKIACSMDHHPWDSQCKDHDGEWCISVGCKNGTALRACTSTSERKCSWRESVPFLATPSVHGVTCVSGTRNSRSRTGVVFFNGV